MCCVCAVCCVFATNIPDVYWRYGICGLWFGPVYVEKIMHVCIVCFVFVCVCGSIVIVVTYSSMLVHTRMM